MHTQSSVRNKEGPPPPRDVCGEALPSKVLGPGAGGMWKEGLAEGLVACTKEKSVASEERHLFTGF